MRLAGLVPRLEGHDAVAVLLILLRGGLNTVQFAGGWLLARRRPQGPPIACAAFLAGACLTLFDVGLGLAPSSVYPWLRWQVTGAYCAYALAAAWFLRARR